MTLQRNLSQPDRSRWNTGIGTRGVKVSLEAAEWNGPNVEDIVVKDLVIKAFMETTRTTMRMSLLDVMRISQVEDIVLTLEEIGSYTRKIWLMMPSDGPTSPVDLGMFARNLEKTYRSEHGRGYIRASIYIDGDLRHVIGGVRMDDKQAIDQSIFWFALSAASSSLDVSPDRVEVVARATWELWKGIARRDCGESADRLIEHAFLKATADESKLVEGGEAGLPEIGMGTPTKSKSKPPKKRDALIPIRHRVTVKVQQFFESMCCCDDLWEGYPARVRVTDVFTAYKEWILTNGDPWATPGALGLDKSFLAARDMRRGVFLEIMRELGHSTFADGRGRFFYGFCLR